MEGFFLSTSSSTCSCTTSYYCSFRLWVPSSSGFRRQYYIRRSNVSLLPRKPRRKEVFLVYAAASNSTKGEAPELDKRDQLELKFGCLIGEDPDLTLAKIIGRKSNPELSLLEIEKFCKNEGEEGFSEIGELPIDVSDIRKPLKSTGNSGISEITEVPCNVPDVRKPSNPTSGLNLVRPVLKKGVKIVTNDKSSPRAPRLKRPSQLAARMVDDSKQSGPSTTLRKPTNDKPSPRAPSVKRPSQQFARTVDNSSQSRHSINLCKPTSICQDNVGTEKLLGLSEEWDLSVKIGERQSNERLGYTKLVRKSDPGILKNEEEASREAETVVSNATEEDSRIKSGTMTYVPLLRKPETVNLDCSGNQKPEVFNDAIKESSNTEGGISIRASIFQRFFQKLFQKHEIMNLNLNGDRKHEDSVNALGGNNSLERLTLTDVSVLSKPKLVNPDLNGDQKQKDSKGQSWPNSDTYEQMVTVKNIELEPSPESGDNLLLRDHSASLQRPPKRWKFLFELVSFLIGYLLAKLRRGGEGTGHINSESATVESENFSAKPPIKYSKEHEDIDWARAEYLIKRGGQYDVELIKVSTRGFSVSFGSLIGFLPYRNVGRQWRYLPFEAWLRREGLDPSIYKQNPGIVGKYEATSVKTSSGSSIYSKADNKFKIDGKVSPHMTLEYLLAIYEQEKLKYLSSLVGQKVKVYVLSADKESRRLIFSTMQKELIEKTKRLMAKLSIGDVVKCCITKITYFGIFVEVEGVPALIHQSEVPLEATLDPSSFFKSGQVIEARVLQLDFSLKRIGLSLKEKKPDGPDPLFETLKSILRDQPTVDGSLEAAQADIEWSDVESFIQDLRQYEGIQSVSKGRCFLSAGVALTFQVYIASLFEDQYKLLARSGYKVQEVIVKTSLTVNEMKSATLTCTNRVKRRSIAK